MFACGSCNSLSGPQEARHQHHAHTDKPCCVLIRLVCNPTTWLLLLTSHRGLLLDLNQAQVTNLDLWGHVGCQVYQDVVGLEVKVDDVPAMQVRQPLLQQHQCQTVQTPGRVLQQGSWQSNSLNAALRIN